MTKREPWQDPPVHPAAALLQMMSDAELDELAADIKATGLQQPIVVWVDNSAAAKGSAGPFPTYLLDGRNRLAALKLLGIKDPRDAPRAKAAQYTPGWGVRYLSALVKTSDLTSRGMSKPKWRPDVNPTTFVLSMNVHRRHLTSEQKRQAIAAYLKADPTTSDRKVAKELGVDNKTAAKVRADLEAREEIPHVPTRTDSAGRKQPATKRKPTPKPEATPKSKATPKPEPPMSTSEYDANTIRLIERYWRYLSWGEDVDGFEGLVDWIVDPEGMEEPDFIFELDEEIRTQIKLLHDWIGGASTLNTDWVLVPNGKGGFKRRRESVARPHTRLTINAVIMHFGVETVAESLNHYQEATKEEGQS
jgi:hypothetical protein